MALTLPEVNAFYAGVGKGWFSACGRRHGFRSGPSLALEFSCRDLNKEMNDADEPESMAAMQREAEASGGNPARIDPAANT